MNEMNSQFTGGPNNAPGTSNAHRSLDQVVDPGPRQLEFLKEHQQIRGASPGDWTFVGSGKRL